MAFGSWGEIVKEPAAARHLLQLYREPASMHRAVAQWAREPLERGGAVILVGAGDSVEGALAQLRDAKLDVAALRRDGRLVIIDGDELMSRFMIDGIPDGDKFRAAASSIIQRARAACEPGQEVRAWGEMVNLLFHRDNLPAAQKLEVLWNDVIDAEGIRLLCSYGLDNLDPRTHQGPLAAVCAGHSHLIPEDDFDRFDRAVSAALVDNFGEGEAALVRLLFAAKRHIPIGMPPAEAVLVALSETHPEIAKHVLASTRSHLRRSGGS